MDQEETDFTFEEVISAIEILDRCIQKIPIGEVFDSKRKKAEVCRENFILREMFRSAKKIVEMIPPDTPLNDEQLTAFFQYQRYLEKYYSQIFEADNGKERTKSESAG